VIADEVSGWLRVVGHEGAVKLLGVERDEGVAGRGVALIGGVSEETATAYNKTVLELHGPDAWLNPM
jgi:hypothetical protein